VKPEQVLESDNADADTLAIWGRPRERGSNRHEHPLDPLGKWARHAGRAIRVIGEDPSWARIAASTPRIGGAGRGGSNTVEAGRGKDPDFPSPTPRPAAWGRCLG
jgi:hypothetical protein